MFSSFFLMPYVYIVAIDMSPAQNALLELKLAAISHLSYEEYLQLLGEAPSSNRYMHSTVGINYMYTVQHTYGHVKTCMYT